MKGVLRLIGMFAFLTGETLAPSAAGAADTRVTREFSLSFTELQAMTRSLPPEMRSVILASPQDFLHLVAKTMDEPAIFFTLVDKTHALPPEYGPPDLVSIKAYSLKIYWDNVLVSKAIMPAVLEMAGAAKADGITLVFSSGYRSFEYQKYVYAREVQTYGRETADRESARPGASQHQLGTAIDFGSITDAFARTPAGQWLAAHAWEHGFSLSYPQGYESITGYRYESWHYRYITRAGTILQRTYFGDVQQYLLEFLHDNRTVLEAKRLKNG